MEKYITYFTWGIMAPKPYYEDDIDRYLRQDMSSEEREAFERILRDNKALQQEVALQRDITAGITLYGGKTLKKQLQDVDAEEAPVLAQPRKPTGKGSTLYVWLGVAASFTALLLLAILFFNRSGDPQELYAAYYRPYPNIVNPSQRSAGGATDAAGQAMYFYERGDFTQAIERFTREPSLNDQAYRFYLGVSYLGAQQAEQALATFQPLLEDEQGTFYEPALWYSGLAQLQANRPEQAREIFQRIVALQRDYKAEARELLAEL